jgi:hypothetical protein
MRRNIVVLRTSVKLTAAVLGAGVALCACGPLRMGAAAVAGHERISAATLTAQSANLSSAYQADKKKAQIPYPATQIPQEALSWLLRFRVRDALAASQGISVTPGQVQQTLAALEAQVKQGGAASLAEAGVSSGLPPDLIPELGRYQTIGNMLVSRIDGGKTPTNAAGQNALNARLDKLQCLASKSLNIKVNPQFGVFDYGQLSVVPAKSALSAAGPSAGASPAPTPTASPAPELSPPC